MIKAFEIYKDNVTTNWVTILCPVSEFNDFWLSKKIAFYSSLGYSVKVI